MENKTFETSSAEETILLAERFAVFLKPGDVITLEGDLGAGKTSFTKGIAKGIGVKRSVTSPTFTIIKEYHGKMPLYHVDAYRLEGSDEDIGFSEYFYGNGITVVEWAQFIDDFLPEERLNIKIEYLDEHSRTIIFEPIGNYYAHIATSFK